MSTRTILFAAICTLAVAGRVVAQGARQEVQQKLATVKESVARNQAALREYSWTEHTEILLRGELKKATDEICRYGTDGKLQKTRAAPQAPPKEAKGVKKKIVDKKVDELQGYLERAGALIQEYVPPSAQRMEAAFQAGNASLGQAASGRIQLHFKDYLKPADALIFDFDAEAKALTKVSVKSYLDSQTDAVTLDMGFQTLSDGTNYVASTTLTAPARELQIRVHNTTYTKVAQ